LDAELLIGEAHECSVEKRGKKGVRKLTKFKGMSGSRILSEECGLLRKMSKNE